jgi:GNAT superfamily N-acetyltransferase
VSGDLTLRPAGDEAAEFAAAVVSKAMPHHPVKASELLQIRGILGQMGELRWFVIEHGGQPVGWVQVSLAREAPEGQGELFVFLPETGVEGVEAAWALGEREARELGVRIAKTEVWEDETAALEALQRRGWERKRKERFWRLDLAAHRERMQTLHAEAGRRLEARGIRIVSAAELGQEAVYPALYEINQATEEDIPRSLPRTPEPYEAWLGWMQPPGSLPERVWVALSDGRPVGYSYLDYGGAIVSTGYTGVLRSHRGRGVARALKLRTVVQAVELGVEAVETDNDSENAPILHLNEELGYSEILCQIQFHKPLAVPV